MPSLVRILPDKTGSAARCLRLERPKLRQMENDLCFFGAKHAGGAAFSASARAKDAALIAPEIDDPYDLDEA